MSKKTFVIIDEAPNSNEHYLSSGLQSEGYKMSKKNFVIIDEALNIREYNLIGRDFRTFC